MPEEIDDERHRREEAARREKRKSFKSNKSDAQLEKERKRKEHALKILQKHGGKKQKTSSPSAIPTAASSSAFQALFKQRAQGFEISFKFRNAPPRPPVGPNFMGSDLDDKLRELSQYKPLNSVEVNYRWKLHSEPDLGVPLAPSAIDPSSYQFEESDPPPLDPADLNLLEWKGSLGDTAAEELKKSRDNARAAARLALMGNSSSNKLMERSKSPWSKSAAATSSASNRKIFSRVLNEGMQSWMKKTTYITNDYTRKVHDFKSLAKTKQEVEQDLELKQQQIAHRRTAAAVAKTFEDCKPTVVKHPSKPHIKPVAEMEFLPDIQHWGFAYTHVVVDKSPGTEDAGKLDQAFVANVQKRDVTARMTCQLFVPAAEKDDNEKTNEKESVSYQAIQQYELDVFPLKEEDTPHVNFCIWVNPNTDKATYVPISSRVQLSSGRPLKKKNYTMTISRRPMSDEDKAEVQERLAEVDQDVDEKVNGDSNLAENRRKVTTITVNDDDDDDDDDSDHDASFMNNSKTIVAEG